MAYPKILHDNNLDDATPAASTTAAGYDVLNVRDWRPYTWWKPTAGPSTITVNCGSAQAADYGLVYAEPGTYQVRGSTDNFAASDNLLGTITITATGLGAVFFTSASYQYWRITSTTGTPAIAIAAIGAVLEIPAYLDSGFDPVGREPQGQVNTSEAGHPLGSVTRFEEWSASLKFSFVTWDWLRDTWLPAWQAHLRDEPFVFAWETDGYADEIRLVMRKGGFKGPHQPGSYADLSFDVMGVA